MRLVLELAAGWLCPAVSTVDLTSFALCRPRRRRSRDPDLSAGANRLPSDMSITDIDRSVTFHKALDSEENGQIPIREERINGFMGLPDD